MGSSSKNEKVNARERWKKCQKIEFKGVYTHFEGLASCIK